MSRTTWNIATETAETLESVANRRDDESANDFIQRVAAMLDDSDDGMDVTSYDTGDKPTLPENVLTTAEFKAYMRDFLRDLPEQTAEHIEDRFG